MSILSEHIDKHPKKTKRLLGLDYEALQQLIEQAELIHKQQKSERITVIASGGGRKCSLSNRDQILLTLTYLRQHHTFEWLGLNFGVCESTAHNIFNYWIKILSSLLPPSLLEQFQDEDDKAEILETLSDVELIVDSSEQVRQRPTDKEEREKLYSGYKHNYTSKNFCSTTKRRRHY
jgi:Helix-turn-helix of DDE superfamily endonuclease